MIQFLLDYISKLIITGIACHSLQSFFVPAKKAYRYPTAICTVLL